MAPHQQATSENPTAHPPSPLRGCVLVPVPASTDSSRVGALQALASYTLFGRAGACHVRLDEHHVSTTHACIRWTGDAWRMQDLGSTNGTYWNGHQLAHAEQVTLSVGDTVSFGGASTFRVQSVARPPIAAVPLSGASPEFEADGLIALPTRENPIATLFATQEGWVMESCMGQATLRDGDVVTVDGEAWRFHCPLVVRPTEALGESTSASAAGIQLTFRVSSDEEHVAVIARQQNESHVLPDRACLYLLLTLARARLEDIHAGIAEASAGWVESADLRRQLRATEPQINVDIYRLRRLFAEAGIVDAPNIVERRARLGKVRIGTSLLHVERT